MKPIVLLFALALAACVTQTEPPLRACPADTSRYPEVYPTGMDTTGICGRVP